MLDTSPDAIVGRVRHSRELVDAYNKTSQANGVPPLQLHYTEWSSSYTATDYVHDQYIEAAFILEKLKETSPLAQSMSYWTFTDIFEENGPPTRPFYGGFGLMNLQGIRKPAYFAYKFLAQLGPEDIAVDDPHAWATRKPDGSVQVLLWNYKPMTSPTGEPNQIFFKKEQPTSDLPAAQLNVAGLHDGTYEMAVYRTGYEVNDAYTAYLHMGSPPQLTRAQVAELKEASSGKPSQEETVHVHGGRFASSLPMHVNDTVLVTFTPTH